MQSVQYDTKLKMSNTTEQEVGQMDKLTEKVGGWLQKSGNTKKKMAAELGITPDSLTNKLTNETPWLWSEVCKVALIIGCDLNDLK